MILQRAGQLAPLIQGLCSPGPGSIGPDVFELFLEDQYRIDDLIEFKQML